MGPKFYNLINSCLQRDIPFVSYRLPDEKITNTWIQPSKDLQVFTDFGEVTSRTGFVYMPFRVADCLIYLLEPEIHLENEDFDEGLIKGLRKHVVRKKGYSLKLPVEISKQEYLQQAGNIIRSFNKDFSKAVLSRIQLVQKPVNFNAGNFFCKLLDAYPSAFCHLIHIPGRGTWAGTSPETFLRMDENSAWTVSLAGTLQKTSGDKKDVQWKQKELEEQRLVSNYIIEVFRQFNIKDFLIEGPQTIQAGNALHLATKFSFEKSLIVQKLADFIRKLHPTPAVCGVPKETAIKKILSIEKHNREYYSGFCGPINFNHRTDLFVNIRCMKILENNCELFVGGGLTARSVPEKEWEETQIKALTLLSVL